MPESRPCILQNVGPLSARIEALYPPKRWTIIRQNRGPVFFGSLRPVSFGSLRRYLLERYARYSFQRYLRYPLSDIISYGRDPHRANITHSANIPHSANITYLPHQIYSHKMPVSTKFEPSPDRFHGKLPSGSMVGGSCLTPSRSPGLRAFRIREKFAMSKKNFLLDAFWEFFL